jgi:hypothetical protein
MKEGSHIKTKPDIPWSEEASADFRQDPEAGDCAGQDNNGTGPDFHGPHGGAGPNPENPAGQHGSKSTAAWPEPPQPLEEYLSPVLPITADMMPEAVADWAVDIARRLRCPLDYVATPAIVTTGSVIASRVRMRPLHYNPWEIAPNLWGASSANLAARRVQQWGWFSKRSTA